jgi:hypothetical protein
VDAVDPIKGVRHSACHLRQRLRRGQVPAGTTARAASFRWSRKELRHGSCQKDDTFSQNSSAQEHQTRRTEALVTPRDEGERRARPQTTGAYRSALSMLTFYINRAGKTLPQTQRTRLERAKVELKRAFGRE